MNEVPKIVSVDDHVVEPPHVWQTWLPEKWRERGPRVVRKKWGPFVHLAGAKYTNTEDPDGEWGDAWVYDGTLIYVQKKFVAIPKSATPPVKSQNRRGSRLLAALEATSPAGGVARFFVIEKNELAARSEGTRLARMSVRRSTLHQRSTAATNGPATAPSMSAARSTP